MSISRKLLQTQPATGGGVVWTDPDLTNASYESLSFSVSSQETVPQDVFFKPDKHKLTHINIIETHTHIHKLNIKKHSYTHTHKLHIKYTQKVPRGNRKNHRKRINSG